MRLLRALPGARSLGRRARSDPRPDLTNTYPAATTDPSRNGRRSAYRLVDPWGHLVAAEFKAEITKARTFARPSRSPPRLDLIEMRDAIRAAA